MIAIDTLPEVERENAICMYKQIANKDNANSNGVRIGNEMGIIGNPVTFSKDSKCSSCGGYDTACANYVPQGDKKKMLEYFLRGSD
jgi:hypothetical protein